MSANSSDFDAASWLDQNPKITHLRTALFDLNGLLRGKIVPSSQLSKVVSGGMRMPLSTVNLDIWGRDIAGSKWVFASGDADGSCKWTGRGPLPIDWTSRSTALLPLSLRNNDGTPFDGDPRNVLESVLKRLAAHALFPVAAFEMEFYLVDPEAGQTTPQGFVPGPGSGAQQVHDGTLAIDELDSYDTFISEIYDACRQQNIEVDTFISESGMGQFEVNLLHSDDLLKVADDAALFKHVAKGIAQQHGLTACFMAKPFPQQPGSGMHVHLSMLNHKGKNVFDDGTDEGSEIFFNAIAGAIRALPDSMLIFAPHQNSYRRFLAETHAPIIPCWGYENRTAAIRVPLGPSSQRRLEHRVAGADTNPYLVLAAILSAVLFGIEDKLDPGMAIEGNAYEADIPPLPLEWGSAIDLFANSDLIKRMLPLTLVEMFGDCKQQERQRFAIDVSPFEYRTYLDQC
jgi:glutamine synthetase